MRRMFGIVGLCTILCGMSQLVFAVEPTTPATTDTKTETTPLNVKPKTAKVSKMKTSTKPKITKSSQAVKRTKAAKAPKNVPGSTLPTTH